MNSLKKVLKINKLKNCIIEAVIIVQFAPAQEKLFILKG